MQAEWFRICTIRSTERFAQCDVSKARLDFHRITSRMIFSIKASAIILRLSKRQL